MFLRNVALLVLVASSTTIKSATAERRILRKGWQVGTAAETEDEVSNENNIGARKLPKNKKSSDDSSGSTDVVGRADNTKTGYNWGNTNYAGSFSNQPVIRPQQQKGGGGKDKSKGDKQKGGGGGGSYAGTFQYPDYSNSINSAAWNPKGVVISNSNANYASGGAAGSPNLISTTQVQSANSGMTYNVKKVRAPTICYLCNRYRSVVLDLSAIFISLLYRFNIVLESIFLLSLHNNLLRYNSTKQEPRLYQSSPAVVRPV